MSLDNYSSGSKKNHLNNKRIKYVIGDTKNIHRVRKGESLYQIAKRYRTTVGELKRLNKLASDTIVVLGEEVFGKPEGKFDAVRMLLRLSEKRHRVLTAVSVMCHGKSKTICSETVVTFRAITTVEAEDYWKSGEPRGKAGAYAIQGFGAIFIHSIKGSYSGVMGLPLFETAELLREFGIDCWQEF